MNATTLPTTRLGRGGPDVGVKALVHDLSVLPIPGTRRREWGAENLGAVTLGPGGFVHFNGEPGVLDLIAARPACGHGAHPARGGSERDSARL
ncbi:hypothetical protein JGS22_017065 [Streptomyces sp. P38-E01]|uniref:Uncharacterized protein n=1 Tax=Streptomyces tardus TaxID=2780544 RepID=A0A949JI35_9ACTN|nr:hypothetical protein [Streptomyces tardus]MBU7599278.1 hypothetical protein [Streptomyces tardus]